MEEVFFYRIPCPYLMGHVAKVGHMLDFEWIGAMFMYTIGKNATFQVY